MGFEIDSSDLEEAFGDLSEEAAEEAAGRWFSASQERLLEAGDAEEYDAFPVAQAGQPPARIEDGYEFAYPHIASGFFNNGTEPHEIEAKRAEFLAFEWPDAPIAVQEMFEDTFPTVFFKSVRHPGTPALRYMERGRDEAIRGMEGQR